MPDTGPRVESEDAAFWMNVGRVLPTDEVLVLHDVQSQVARRRHPFELQF